MEAASLGFTPEAGVSCENVTCDFSDAYCHVMVHPEELKNCLVALRLLPQDPASASHSCAVWGLVRRVHHSHGAGSQPLLEGLRKECCWGPAGQATQLAGSTRTSTTPSSTCSVRKSSETSSYGPCYSFGPRLGQRGRDPKWPSGSGQSSHQIAQAIQSPSGSQPRPQKLQAGCTGTVRRTDVVAAENAPPAGGKRWLDMNLLPKARWTLQRLCEAIAKEERRQLLGGRPSTEAHPRRSTHLPDREASGRSSLTLDLGRPRSQLLQSFRGGPARRQNSSWCSTRPRGTHPAKRCSSFTNR